ncbi:TRAP transporter large permease subunit [Marinovum sp. E06]|uniref:TRAP transporter large permease subunit n=1 Tax=Marinovum sp. E06 TaxID=3449225 RepID=UPI003EDBBCEE
MDTTTLAILGFAALLILLFLRMSVGAAMLLVGAVGIWMIRPAASLPVVAGEIFGEASNYSLTILPLFILMGNLAGISGMSRDLYDAAHSWIGHLKGGLASATIVGCAGFSALSGSSLAAALTMGKVSLPEMQRYRYHDGLATGSIAAGGTLGILIPPSAGFVIYAILTEESIGRLFMAGVLPGLLLTTLFILAIYAVVTLNPNKAPTSRGPRACRSGWQRWAGRSGSSVSSC